MGIFFISQFLFMVIHSSSALQISLRSPPPPPTEPEPQQPRRKRRRLPCDTSSHK